MFRVLNSKRNSDSCASCKPPETVLSATLMLLLLLWFFFVEHLNVYDREKQNFGELTDHIMDHKSVITDTKPFFVRNCLSWFFITHLLLTKKNDKTKKREKQSQTLFFRHSHRLVLSLDHPSSHPSIHCVSHCAFWSKINHIVSCEIHLGRHYHYMHIL